MSTTLNEYANELYENSRAHGFYDHEDQLRKMAGLVNEPGPDGGSDIAKSLWNTILSEHYGNRLMLIVGEAVEAHEELRAGRAVGELYFSGKNDRGEYTWHEPNAPITGELLKPEGVLAELADVAIRSLETMAGILANLSDDEATRLRQQVPASEYTTAEAVTPGVGADGIKEGPVNVAEILNLKHEFNLSRAPRHGGKAF